ncbi:hypothetical protein QYE76_026769 [Lolium multiflorum]|uniref:Retrotransposon gag domain-containing protein n=1 Tax=Lolium multiflorum TaxID=4521 RepID=A0AAD8RJ88_LOLMU|nr:hypothetical protein QYE76_026769 [Lolium multiflorum]
MNGQMMTWADFKLKFSKYHVPPGLIKKMRDEFRELKQGRMSVVEYRDGFLTLSSREKVHKIREYLKTAQSRQKSYGDKRRRDDLEIGDFVYLKVSPLKGMQKGKLAPRYVGPFKVLSRRASTVAPDTPRHAMQQRRTPCPERQPPRSPASPLPSLSASTPHLTRPWKRSMARGNAAVTSASTIVCHDLRAPIKLTAAVEPRLHRHHARQPRQDTSNAPRPSLASSPEQRPSTLASATATSRAYKRELLAGPSTQTSSPPHHALLAT